MVATVTISLTMVAGAFGSYDESRALKYAKFAGAAYCAQSSLESWSCGSKCSEPLSQVTVCNGATTKSFVGLWEGKCLVSFEGTSNVQSAITDLEFVKSGASFDGCNDCEVHSGFLSEYKSMKTCIQSALEAKGCPKGSAIRTTGHSLGAATNTLAMMDLVNSGWNVEESYDFGKPRVGNANFAAAFNSAFTGKAWRVTHAKDPVPQVPPTDLLDLPWHFQHVEPEIYYPGSVSDGYETCTTAQHTCAEYWWNVPIDLLHIADHLDYMGVDTSTFGCSSMAANTTLV